ncbi:MAG: molybdenum cofactor guanylyltransferase [Verrucomicrobia bacterium]|nr:molybdenum cofactor guanylyltransferase [Verrucomicrobiota bacterium]
MSPRSFSAAILAGGRSSRMGRDKALCSWRGRPFWQVTWELAGAAGASERYLCGPRRHEFPPEVECLPDSPAGLGPLAGVAAALGRARTPWVLVVAVDMPLLRVSDLRALLEGPGDQGRVPVWTSPSRRLYEPLVALYPANLAARAVDLLRAGEDSVQALLRQAVEERRIEEWPVPEDRRGRFRSLNDPSELAAAAAALDDPP